MQLAAMLASVWPADIRVTTAGSRPQLCMRRMRRLTPSGIGNVGSIYPLERYVQYPEWGWSILHVVPCCTQSALTTLSAMNWASAGFQLYYEQYPGCRVTSVL